MRLCRRPVVAEAEPTNRELLALSWKVQPPRPCDNQYLDGHNDAVYEIQCYLNGKALGSESMVEKKRWLELRAEIEWMKITPEALAKGDTA